MSLENSERFAVFFLSVTALICLVLDHLLCPAAAACVVEKGRMQPWQSARWVDVLSHRGNDDREAEARARRMSREPPMCDMLLEVSM